MSWPERVAGCEHHSVVAVKPVALLDAAMRALSARRPIFHSEADFQHALAWEIQTTHRDAEIRLEKRVAIDPSINIDILVTVGRSSFGIELKYPRRSMSVEVDGEVFTLATGADDHGRVYALEDFARLERLVEDGVLASGIFVMLTNIPNVWMPAASKTRVLYDEFRIHDGHTLSGRMAWGDWGEPGGRPSGRGIVELRGTYPLVWRHYSHLPGGDFRYLLVGIEPVGTVPVTKRDRNRWP
jgi:hypothetical protein